MLQLINKKKIYFYILVFFTLTTFFNNNFDKFYKKKFLINKINIYIEPAAFNEQIKLRLYYLKSENIFSINKNVIKDKVNSLNYLENIQIKKVYPETINITASQTDIIAITYLNQKKYFVGNNGKYILANKLNIKKKLPTIFGKFEISDFLLLKSALNDVEVSINNITKYYFHKNKRWDVYFNNNILIKLPNRNISHAYKLFNKFKQSNEIKPNTVVDLRIKNRIVLKNEQ